jgi:hypothetical protein
MEPSLTPQDITAQYSNYFFGSPPPPTAAPPAGLGAGHASTSGLGVEFEPSPTDCHELGVQLIFGLEKNWAGDAGANSAVLSTLAVAERVDSFAECSAVVATSWRLQALVRNLNLASNTNLNSNLNPNPYPYSTPSPNPNRNPNLNRTPNPNPNPNPLTPALPAVSCVLRRVRASTLPI